MAEDGAPTREELLKARADLLRQHSVLMNPVRGRGGNPALLARLKQMIADIDACLADLPDDA